MNFKRTAVALREDETEVGGSHCPVISAEQRLQRAYPTNQAAQSVLRGRRLNDWSDQGDRPELR